MRLCSTGDGYDTLARNDPLLMRGPAKRPSAGRKIMSRPDKDRSD